MIGFGAGAPRRAPYPFDMVVAGTPLMCGRQKGPDGSAVGLVGTRPQDQASVNPSAYEYDAQNPLFERVFPWDDLTLGFGEKVMRQYKDRKYRYAIGVDATVAGKTMMGPNITGVTPSTTDSTNGVTPCFGFELAGVLYVCAGRYILSRTNDSTFATSLDLGSGNHCSDAVVFYSNGLSKAYAWVASVNDSTGVEQAIYWFDGTTWTQSAQIQTVTISGSPTGGTYTLTYNSNTTSSIAYNASASAVQTALQALTGLGSVTVTQTGASPNVTNTITMTGAGITPGAITGTDSMTGGTHAVATAISASTLTARAWAVAGREFWRATATNQLSKCDTNADPTNANNWETQNAFFVGDKNSFIERLMVSASGALAIFKTDGIYTLDRSGEDHNLYPFMHFGNQGGPGTDNGKFVGQFENDLHATYNGGHFRLDASFGYQPIGPEQITGNDSPVRGRVTAFQGHRSLNAYAGLYNDDTGNSYLLKFGAWQPYRLSFAQTPIQVDEARRTDAWHGSISQTFSSKKITAMWESGIGAPSGHTRMWLGFSDGSLAYFILPCVPDPSACSDYQFSTTTSYLYPSLWDGTFFADLKALRRWTVGSLNLSSSQYINVGYNVLPGVGDYVDIGQPFNTSPAQTVDFPKGSSGALVDFQWTFTNKTTSSSPIVMGMGLHHALRLPPLLLYAFDVLAADGLVKRDGMPMRIGATEIRTAIIAAVTAAGSTTTIMPDESVQELNYIAYDESMAWDERAMRWRSSLHVQAAQYQNTTPFGEIQRLLAYTIGDLQPYTIEQLSAF